MGAKNSLTSTPPPLPDIFLQEKLDREKNKNRKPIEKKKNPKPNDPAQEKGFWIMFSASMTLAGSVLKQAPGSVLYG